MTEQEKLMDTLTQLGILFRLREFRIMEGTKVGQQGVEIVLGDDPEVEFQFDTEGNFITFDFFVSW